MDLRNDNNEVRLQFQFAITLRRLGIQKLSEFGIISNQYNMHCNPKQHNEMTVSKCNSSQQKYNCVFDCASQRHSLAP